MASFNIVVAVDASEECAVRHGLHSQLAAAVRRQGRPAKRAHIGSGIALLVFVAGRATGTFTKIQMWSSGRNEVVSPGQCLSLSL
jgi:hypothetical protein